ncbi:hypothetical protein DTW90_35850 [Neorhizobium sp. P12A]|uniref:hypothetical protein n=1 Tax=Neorhizobium sp. P12A TaxID=2268027 RepID=UPI0011ECEC00|nr:hypothetical protein [Neorhizobium sp. P12A]KAA0684789.1 hypothetical protein DTW90_35850 [Neorhizobium sp. P12A]
MSKITNGLNDRPLGATIARRGISNSRATADASEKEIERDREKLLGEHGAAESTKCERDKDRSPEHDPA